jgi:NAD(P)-dependent dehydrogenase (short-subunit alcohol dehydrogenase family)
MLLTDKVALVTGGAGQGMGRATSLRLAEEGASVVIADIDEEAARNLVGTLTAAGRSAAYIRCDVTQPDEVAAAVDFAVVTFGGVDILHNHAIGPWVLGYLGDLSFDQWDTGVRNVLSPAFYAIKTVLPWMIARGGGSIVNTSSAAGLGSQRKTGIYSVAKSAPPVSHPCDRKRIWRAQRPLQRHLPSSHRRCRDEANPGTFLLRQRN